MISKFSKDVKKGAMQTATTVPQIDMIEFFLFIAALNPNFTIFFLFVFVFTDYVVW